mmetsp:Transcript_26298/g.56946  ORF Transcript_26298/g.56946 Transcript_26298/m.56946 type:complete len:257 (+) Transcript_26298:624-1394(+)
MSRSRRGLGQHQLGHAKQGDASSVCTDSPRALEERQLDDRGRGCSRRTEHHPTDARPLGRYLPPRPTQLSQFKHRASQCFSSAVPSAAVPRRERGRDQSLDGRCRRQACRARSSQGRLATGPDLMPRGTRRCQLLPGAPVAECSRSCGRPPRRRTDARHTGERSHVCGTHMSRRCTPHLRQELQTRRGAAGRRHQGRPECPHASPAQGCSPQRPEQGRARARRLERRSSARPVWTVRTRCCRHCCQPDRFCELKCI